MHSINAQLVDMQDSRDEKQAESPVAEKRGQHAYMGHIGLLHRMIITRCQWRVTYEGRPVNDTIFVGHEQRAIVPDCNRFCMTERMTSERMMRIFCRADMTWHKLLEMSKERIIYVRRIQEDT